MTDDFIASLKTDWTHGGEAAVLRLRRRRWIPHALLAADLLGAVTMAVSGAVYAVLAVRDRDLLFGLSAVAMLPVGLPLIAAGVRMRWRALAWQDETSEGVLQSSLHRLQATRRVLALAGWGSAVLFALAALVWLASLAGWLREPRPMLLLIVATWVLAGALGLAWVGWRQQGVGRQIAGCETLLRQFQDSGG
jgi:hypothetical protein